MAEYPPSRASDLTSPPPSYHSPGWMSPASTSSSRSHSLHPLPQLPQPASHQIRSYGRSNMYQFDLERGRSNRRNMRLQRRNQPPVRAPSPRYHTIYLCPRCNCCHSMCCWAVGIVCFVSSLTDAKLIIALLGDCDHHSADSYNKTVVNGIKRSHGSELILQAVRAGNFLSLWT